MQRGTRDRMKPGFFYKKVNMSSKYIKPLSHHWITRSDLGFPKLLYLKNSHGT